VKDRVLAWVVVGSVVIVFVGSFVVGIFDPGYQGDAAVGPAMGALGGAAVGIILSRRNGNGNGKVE
jgi:hypothetical protein